MYKITSASSFPQHLPSFLQFRQAAHSRPTRQKTFPDCQEWGDANYSHIIASKKGFKPRILKIYRSRQFNGNGAAKQRLQNHRTTPLKELRRRRQKTGSF